MKNYILFVLLFSFGHSFSQTEENPTMEKTQVDSVTFLAAIDLRMVTKDGIYLNDYVVNISYSELQKLDKKQVEITGFVTIIKGIVSNHDQGRNKDTKYIENPSYRIIDKP